jgi:hypothetical protein
VEGTKDPATLVPQLETAKSTTFYFLVCGRLTPGGLFNNVQSPIALETFLLGDG